MSQASDSTARAVITQVKKMLKDRSIQPTVKLTALQLFHKCMELNNVPFLLFAQKKVLRRFGEFARHRKTSADPARGADIFGPVQGEQQAASVEFLKLLLQSIKTWASRYGIAPNGGDSDYLKLYRTLQAERVVFPADSRAPAPMSSPRAQQNSVSKLQADISKCKQTADLLRQMLAANPNQSEIGPTASEVNAYKTQMEMEIQTRSNQSASEAEINMLLDAHDHLSKALDTYQDYRRSRSQDPKTTSLQSTLQQTQTSIDKTEKELSELRNRIYFMRTTEDQSNPEVVRREIETRIRDLDENHRRQLAQLSSPGQPNSALLDQQLAETVRQVEQMQAELRQKAVEIDRDNRMYAQVSAENRELARKQEEESKRAYIKAVESPPESPDSHRDPSFFASARQSLDPFSKQDGLDLSVFQTMRSPVSQSNAPMQVDASSLPIVNEKEYRLLCFQDKGLLFEDAVVKMGAQLVLAGNSGKLAVFLGNGSQEVLDGVAIQVIPAAGVELQQQEAKGPVQVQPGQKIVFTLQVDVQQPFAGCPRLLVVYTHQRNPIYLHLKLPIILARALQPTRYEASEAYRAWQSLVDTEDLTRFSGLQAGITSMNSLASVVRFRSNLQLYGAKDLPELEKGAVLGFGSLGEQLVVAMVTIEGNAKSGKIAVRSRSMRLRDGMLGLLKEFIVG
jgi:hypothetical protein